MSDITELERRITAALDRIGTGLDAVVSTGHQRALTEKLAAAEKLAAELEGSLNDETLANAQLEERMKGIRETADRHASAMDTQAQEQRRTTSKLDGDVQRLRRAAEELRASNISLRSALEQGVSEPHLINKAMMAELETLRAARSVEIAQADAVIAALEPLVQNALNDDSQNAEIADA